ncbi:MAG: beta-galactosidase [Fimbriimonadaceae bacterium]|nr:beta-galactosidase [Fimbriimonadaceae bacterium]
MLTIVTGALLAVGGMQATSVAAQRGLEASPFAINGTKLFHVPGEVSTTVARRLAWMKELGVRWDRTDLWWHVVEPEPGRFDFSRPDLAIATFEKAGVQWYPILCYGAAWFKDRTGPQTEDEFAAFAHFANRIVSRYRGRVPYWSVWNEPNIAPFWTPRPNPDHYARLLRLAAAAIRKADPKAKVCAPAIAPIGPWDRAFTERLFQLGGLRDLDVFDYHYYRNGSPEEEVPTEIAEIRATMRRYGKEKPIWVSETGVSTWFDGVESPERQAALVVRNQLLCLAHGVSRVFYFDLQNWFDDQPQTWDTHLGLVKASGEPKPSFHAYRTLVREVGRRRVVGPIRALGKSGTGVLLYDRATGRYTLAAWIRPLSGTESVPLATLPGAEQVGPYGDRRPLAPGEPSVVLSPNPAFFVGVRSDRFLAEAGVRFDAPLTILAVGETGSLRLVTDASIPNPSVSVRRVEADGLDWNPITGRLRAPKGTEIGLRVLRAHVAVSWGGRRDRVRRTVVVEAKVRVEPAVTVTMRPGWSGQGIFAAGTVKNSGTRDIRGRIEGMRQAGTWSTTLFPSMPVRVAARGEAAFRAPIALATAPKGEEIWTVRGFLEQARPVWMYPVPLGEPPSPIVVDGRLGEWEATPAALVGRASQVVRNPSGWEPESASARFWCRFAPEGFFLAAEVTDDDPMVNDEPPYTMWRMDSVELYLGLGGPTARTVLDKSLEYQLGFAPTSQDGKPDAFWFHEDRPIAGARVAARRTRQGYALEAWVPWSGIRADASRFRPGMAVGLDFKINDRDRRDRAPAGEMPGRDLVWNGTGANWIDPSNWGIGVLVRG